MFGARLPSHTARCQNCPSKTAPQTGALGGQLCALVR